MNIIWKILIIPLIIGMVLLTAFIYVYETSKSIKFERRITDFAITSAYDSELSLFERLATWLYNIVNKLAKRLKKKNYFPNLALKYEKYLEYDSKFSPYDCISIKLLVAFFLCFINIITSFNSLNIWRLLSIIVTFIVGFYSVDVFFILKLQKKKRAVRGEILRAIIYINSALASGFTIYQSINMVSKEFKGAIGLEFAKVSEDLAYGLSLEKAFARFYERIKIPELKYIWTTLSLLNKEGGDGRQIFNIIEKNFLDEQNMMEEAKVVISPLKVLTKIVMLIPLFVIIGLLIWKRNYFAILKDMKIGPFVLITIILLYVLYYLVIRKLLGGSKK